MKSEETLFSLNEEERKFRDLHLHLDMTRGKPCPEQLQLSEAMASLPLPFDHKTEEGTDLRNYGNPYGLIEAKRLMGSLVHVADTDRIFILGNSSLEAMFSVINHAYIRGFLGDKPWKDLPEVKWLCPVPGYDRHFGITEYFGIKMINVPLLPTGPDMDLVERLVSSDPSIKGIWCVPKFSNPSGYVYSDETVRRMATLRPAAKDFRVFWDNAYFVHDLEEPFIEIPEILSLAYQAGNPNMVIEFLSTSKITFPGSGISAILSSKENLEDFSSSIKIETIGFDKMNQMRHVLFLKDREHTLEHMRKHAEILRPKFELVAKILRESLVDFASWTSPKGGYFVTLHVEGCAKEIIAHCRELGVSFTKEGAAFPYGVDIENSTIRIAPTLPSLDELKTAMEVLCCVTKIETLKHRDLAK